MNTTTFIQNILSDIKVEISEEFDRNFERKAFFDQPWKPVLIPNKRGSLMMRSGALRRSIRAQVSGSSVHFSSSLVFAKLQNDGGTVMVTAKMKRFFWAMYYSLVGKVTYNVKSKSANYNKKSKQVTREAAYWRAMALKKVGSKLVIPPRPFLKHHQAIDRRVLGIINRNFKQFETDFQNHLKQLK